MHGISDVLSCVFFQVFHVIMLHEFDPTLEDEQWMYELLWTCQPPDAIAPAAKGAWSSAPGARWIVKWRHGRKPEMISGRVTWNDRVFTHSILLLWNYLEGIVSIHRYWYKLDPRSKKVCIRYLTSENYKGRNLKFGRCSEIPGFAGSIFFRLKPARKISIIIKVCRMHWKEIHPDMFAPLLGRYATVASNLKVVSC